MDKESKIKGCLIAGALGDALGYKVEFMTWNVIRMHYGEKGITELPLTCGKAVFSDDTQMTLFTCEAMLSTRRKSLNWYLQQSYLNWLRTQGVKRIKHSFFKKEKVEAPPELDSSLAKIPEMNVLRAPGNTCISALCDGGTGTTSRPVNDSKGCGGVMRVAPLGFTNKWGTPALRAAEAAAITHGHPLGWMPAGMLADIIYRICHSEKSLEEIIRDSLKTTANRWPGRDIYTLTALVNKAIRFSKSDMADVEAIHQLGGGWVAEEALAIAIYSVLKHQDNIKDALICAVNHSGDSDSTGAIAGNILGAYLGYEAIPKDWEENLELKEVILGMAKNLARIL